MKLRPYQIEDINKLKQFKSCACFNEQRTGKTPTALNLIKEHNCQKAIIITTNSTLHQWKKEYTLWLQQPCIIVSGTPQKRQQQITEWTHGLVISYSTLRTTNTINQILKAKPEMVILDEAHRIKSYNKLTAKTVFKLSKTPYKLALTATPAPNYDYEIWAILHFLYPTTFRSYWKFINEFFETETQKNWTAQKEYTTINGFKNHRQQTRLQTFLNRYSTQRKRKEVMSWLPDKDYQKIYLEPDKTQIKMLNDLQKYYEIENTNIICKGTLDRLVRYRQITLSPSLLTPLPNYVAPKIQWLIDYFTDNPETPTIVFTKFTSIFNTLKPLFPNAEYIQGATPIEIRNEIQNLFQQKKIKHLFAQIDTCKEGLTLDTAESIVFLDKYPPVADIQQAEDRFIATTQDKANKPHTIYELILSNTYDQQLYELIEKRLSETDIINNFNKYLGV